MNRDLDVQLEELGPEYRALVGRMTRACAEPASRRFPSRMLGAFGVGLAAAALAIALVVSAVFRGEQERVYTVRASSAASEYLLATVRDDAAVKEMIRTQNPDGSWKNDFLTRQNAAALRTCSSVEAKIAYKKAMRNLRSKGAL